MSERTVLQMVNPAEAARKLKQKLARDRAAHPERFKTVPKVGQYGGHTGKELDQSAEQGRDSTQAAHIEAALEEKED